MALPLNRESLAKVRSIRGGFGMEWRSGGVGPSGPSEYFEIDGYDSFAKTLKWEGFDSGGGSERATYSIEGDRMTSDGFTIDKGKQYRFRGTTLFTPDRAKASDEREYSVDGKNWKPHSTSRWTKTAKEAVVTRDESVEKEIIRLERIWTATGVNRGADALAHLLADDVTSGTAEGKWLNKSQMLADIRTGEYRATSAEADDMKVRVFGHVAVITGRTTEKSRFKGVDSSGQYIWTDTWVLRDGTWLCVATHGSKVGTKIGPQN